MSDDGKKFTAAHDDPLSVAANRDPNKKEWVKFEEESDDVVTPKDIKGGTTGPAVLDVESITIEITPKTEPNQNGDHLKAGKVSKPVQEKASNAMRNVELRSEVIEEGFVNGEIIVTLLPVNESLPWITSAKFLPHLVPEELMAEGLTLTVEEYVHAMEMLVNDYRFTLYNICYKRVLMCWISLAFLVLLGLLFSGITGILLFSLGVSWLFLNAITVFLCMWVKSFLARGLEKCLARVNRLLVKHKIIITLDDRGNISCHKINLCFIYYDASQCISFINTFLERTEHNGEPVEPGWESRLDLDHNDVVIKGSSNTRVSKKQEIAELVVLRYMQRWAKDYTRRRLDWQMTENGVAAHPRHLRSAYCACQYAEEILLAKIPKSKTGGASCCLCCGSNRGELVILRYASRWGKEMIRNYLKVSNESPGRHMIKSICPCQFIENHLKCKPRGAYCMCCPTYSEHNYMYPY